MREGWEYKTIGDIATVVSGSTPQTSVAEFWGEGHYWVTPAELDDKTVYVSKTERQITDAALAKAKLQRLPKGTVLLSSRAPIGKVAICDVDMYCNQGFKNCICSDLVYNKYLFYFLKDKKEYLNSLGRGATFKEISKGIVEKVVVPLPPKSTQLSIVSELDKLNELIRIKKEQLKDYDTLAQSIFYEMFGDPMVNEKGWEVKKIGDVCKTSSGGTPSKAHDEYYNGDILWLRSGEVGQGDIYDTEQTITLLGLENCSAKIFPVNTVVIAMYGATVGQVGILRKEMSTNQAICGILPNGVLTPEYLNYFLLRMKSDFLKLAIGGAQANISQQIIRKTLIPLPPLSLQKYFTCRIRQIEQQKAAIQKTITDLETLLAARMQYWFD